ncbi:hypothetical protein TNCT_614921, partial [Trichonephila clavata]
YTLGCILVFCPLGLSHDRACHMMDGYELRWS